MVDWEEFYNRFRQPDFISGYEIQNRLGGGAFGEVYKARKSSIGKSYAIKFLKLDESSNQAAIERELEQVRLFAAIDHPNLVTIEDMGLVQGVPYLTMGYAGEDTLARRLKRRDLDRDAALLIFTQVCRGVLALHDRRLAHFDLKPGNVFIKGDVARVGDYGLSKLLTEGRQTLSFGRGTPHYMAPEMLKNRADHRADIYSLGVILYESLTFELPFDARENSGILREEDSPPAFPSAFPVEVRHVVERCLRLSPDERYDSVHELLSELGQTGRQGDSVTLPWTGPPRARPTVVPPEPPPEPASQTPRDSVRDTPSSTGAELKTAAAELARGAALVARGVWEGVSSRMGERIEDADDAGETPTDEAPARASGGDMVSFQTLEEPDADPGRSAPVKRPSWLEAAAMASEPTAPGSAALSATVPVPPRAEGGVPGTIVATFVLGTEILGALLTGPLLVSLRGVGRSVDRAARSVPGILGSTLRFMIYLVICLLVGALVGFLLVTMPLVIG
jgi:serine/threonine protein kinase